MALKMAQTRLGEEADALCCRPLSLLCALSDTHEMHHRDEHYPLTLPKDFGLLIEGMLRLAGSLTVAKRKKSLPGMCLVNVALVLAGLA